MAGKYEFVAYAAQAEARCIHQLLCEFGQEHHFDSFKFIDLYLEWRMLTNHSYSLMYGKQLIDGKEVVTRPAPRGKEPTAENRKCQHSLAAACYKLLGIKIDTKRKTEIRDLIISGKPLTEADKTEILDYCMDDVKYLDALDARMGITLFHRFNRQENFRQPLKEGRFRRGQFAALSAKIEQRGYPIDEPALREFSKRVPDILRKEQEVINKEYDDVLPFHWCYKNQRYTMKLKKIRQWLEEQGISNWEMTDTANFSLSLDAFQKHFSKTSPGFGGAFVRYLRLKQSLNGFMPKPPTSTRKTFWDYVGSDGRARPYLGIYGSQSARSQPAATGFIPLKSNWMRAFIVPPKGRAICGIDYSQQEFLIAALLSNDKNMIAAYESGDPYMSFAILDGAAPKDATKKSHPEIRDIYKTIILATQYNMSAVGLSKKLTQDLGRPYSEDQAEQFLDAFAEAFPTFHEYMRRIIDEYMEKEITRLNLPCGWVMWGDNPNWRSVANFPIQGFGSSIMREAVRLCDAHNLDVIFTLHDAVYIEYDLGDFEAIKTFKKCMDDAFKHYFTTHKNFVSCRTDVYSFSSQYVSETIKIGNFEVSLMNKYLEKRGEADYKRFVTNDAN